MHSFSIQLQRTQSIDNVWDLPDYERKSLKEVRFGELVGLNSNF